MNLCFSLPLAGQDPLGPGHSFSLQALVAVIPGNNKSLEEEI